MQGLFDDDSRAVPPSLRHTGFAASGTEGPPRARYTSRRVHELEVERVWRRVWQMACREEQLPDVGDSIVYDVAGASLIVVRSAPEEIRAFHNSCLHRGTQLRSGPGHVGELRCPFHGFTWRLDGTFAGMPCDWDFPQVDPSRFRLPEARVGRWGGFVFVCMDADTEPLEDYLEILPAHFATWPLDERRLAAHVVRALPCNWKVALEAFIESYHTVAVHPQLLTTSGDAQTEYDTYPGVRHISRMITPVGVASDHAGPTDEQAIVDAMFLTRDSAERTLAVGQRARELLAERTRAQLAARAGRSFDPVSDAEALDAIEYFVFPNFVPWAGYTTPLVYRFRPEGDDHRRSVMDVMLLEPVPSGRPRPPATPTRFLAEGERWAEAPELGFLGPILDQDTATLALVQRGLEAAATPDVTLAHYQESRIRHFHHTLEAHLWG